MKQPVISLQEQGPDDQRYVSIIDDDEVTPIQRAPWFAVLFMVASSFFSANVIIPFVPFLVSRLFPLLDKTELGTRTGFLDGAFFLGVMIGGPIWGRLADKLGRKFALLWGVFAGIGLAVAFGFCNNYMLALGIRFVWGVSGANMSVSRAILAELSDHTNRARMFTALGIGVILGRLLGNGVGGLLAEPAEKYACFDVEFFRQYPYALPVFIAAAINLLSLLVGVIYLPETKGGRRTPSLIGAALLSPSTAQVETKRPGICDVLKQSKTPAMLFSCFFIALCHAIYNVIFTLWVLNTKHNYGFDFGTSAIGMTRVLAVPTDLFLQLYLFPFAVKKMGIFYCYQACALLWAAAVIITPFSSYANRSPIAVQWIALELCVILNNILAMVTLAGNGILCTNLVDNEIRGVFMGIRQSFVGLGRGLGSVFGGIIFSWSLQTDDRSGVLAHLPFNFYFSWLFQAMLMLTVFTLSWFIDGKTLERNPDEWREYHRKQTQEQGGGVK